MTKPIPMLSHLYKLQSHEPFQKQKDQTVGCENVKVEKGFECIPFLISKVIQRIDCMMISISPAMFS